MTIRAWPFASPPLGVPFGVNRASPQWRGLVGWWPALRHGNALQRPDMAGVWPATPAASGLVSTPTPEAGVMSGNHSATYLSCGILPYTASVGALTITAWMRRNAAANNLHIGQATTAAAQLLGIQLFGDGKVYAGVNLNGQLATASASGTGLFHIAMVFDGAGVGNAGRIKAYVNGVLPTQSYFGTTPATTSAYVSTFDLGALGGGSSQSTGGYIGDVRIYNRALSADDVFALWAPHTRWNLYGVQMTRGLAASAFFATMMQHHHAMLAGGRS